MFPTFFGVNFNQLDKQQHFIVMLFVGLFATPFFGWQTFLLGQLPIFTKEIYDHFVKDDPWAENRADIIAGEMGLVFGMLFISPFARWVSV